MIMLNYKNNIPCPCDLAENQIYKAALMARPAIWTVSRDRELLALISARLATDRSLSVRRACRLVARDKDTPLYFRQAGPEALYKRVAQSRKMHASAPH